MNPLFNITNSLLLLVCLSVINIVYLYRQYKTKQSYDKISTWYAIFSILCILYAIVYLYQEQSSSVINQLTKTRDMNLDTIGTVFK